MTLTAIVALCRRSRRSTSLLVMASTDGSSPTVGRVLEIDVAAEIT